MRQRLRVYTQWDVVASFYGSVTFPKYNNIHTYVVALRKAKQQHLRGARLRPDRPLLVCHKVKSPYE